MNNYREIYQLTTDSIEIEALLLLSEAICKYEQNKPIPMFLKHLIEDDKKVNQYIKQFLTDLGWENEPPINSRLLVEVVKFASLKQVNSQRTLTPEELLTTKERIMNDIGRYGYSGVPSFLYELLLELVDVRKRTSILNSYAENSSILYLLNQFGYSEEKFFEIPDTRIAFNFFLNNYLLELKQNEFRIGEPLMEPTFIENNQLMEFDGVVSAPPFDRFYLEDYIQNDLYNRFNEVDITVRDSSIAHIMHVLAHMGEKGKAAILVHGSPLFQTGRRGLAREYLLNCDFVEGVIALSSGLLRNTSIPSFVIVLNKNKANDLKNKVKFFDATSFYNSEHKIKYLSKENLKDVLRIYNSSTQDENIAVVHVKEVLENESILNPIRYMKKNHLFIRGYGYTRIDEKEYDNIPKQSLESVCEVITGSNIKKAQAGKVVKVINGKALQNELINLNEVEEQHVENAEAIQRSKIIPNDIVMLSRGASLKFAIAGDYFAEEEVYATANLFILRPKENVATAYLLSYLNSPFGRLELNKVQKGTTIPMFTAKEIKQLPIPIVDSSIQESIQEVYGNSKQRYEEAIKRAEQELANSNISIYEKMGLMDSISKK